MTAHVARLVRDNTQSFNLINTRTVEILFQRSPNLGEPARGIEGLSFQVRDSDGSLLQGLQRTGVDGRARVPVREGSALLDLVLGESVVTTYRITIRDEPIEPFADPAPAGLTLTLDPRKIRKGLARRLRLLGYQIGDGGPEGNGVEDPPPPAPPPPRPASAPSSAQRQPVAADARGFVLVPGPPIGALVIDGGPAAPISRELDKAILDFQSDEGFFAEGFEDEPNTLNRLESRVAQLVS